MNIMDNGTVRAIADKIKEIRSGNRVMVGEDVDLTVNLYRRSEPEKKCGIIKINGDLHFSLLDAGLCIAAAAALFRIIHAVRCLFRH